MPMNNISSGISVVVFTDACVPLFHFSAIWLSEMQFGVINLETLGGTHWHWCKWCYTNFTQWTHSTNCQPTLPVGHRFTGGPNGSWQTEPPHINTLPQLAFWPQDKEDKFHPQATLKETWHKPQQALAYAMKVNSVPCVFCPHPPSPK